VFTLICYQNHTLIACHFAPSQVILASPACLRASWQGLCRSFPTCSISAKPHPVYIHLAPQHVFIPSILLVVSVRRSAQQRSIVVSRFCPLSYAWHVTVPARWVHATSIVQFDRDLCSSSNWLRRRCPLQVKCPLDTYGDLRDTS
jgi:hypothetical protein